MTIPDPNVALCMVVCDDAQTIGPCLESVRGLVQRWLVVDYGSTDGTPQLIRERMAAIPGELLSHTGPHRQLSRPELIGFAAEKAAFSLVPLANQLIVRSPDFELPPLEADCYEVEVQDLGTSYWKPLIVRNELKWDDDGVLRGSLKPRQQCRRDRLNGIRLQPVEI